MDVGKSIHKDIMSCHVHGNWKMKETYSFILQMNTIVA
jgi:hypothetical protein